MIWDDPIFRGLFDSYVGEVQTSIAMEAQANRQKIEADLSRSGLMSSGVGVIKRQVAYAGPMIRDAVQRMLGAFDRACNELHLEPEESDFDRLFEFLDANLRARAASVTNSIKRHDDRRGGTALRSEQTVRQLEGGARSEIMRFIERGKLRARHRVRQAIPDLREQVGDAISEINTRGRQQFRFSVFQITEPRCLLDLGRAPTTQSELVQAIQALGVLLTQMDHDDLRGALQKAGINKTEGSINKLEQLFQIQCGSAPSAAFEVLRDLARLRNGYPAHPMLPEVVEAARRVGISLVDPEPASAWNTVLSRLLEALRDISSFLKTATPRNASKGSAG